jgi:hypothetical protein
MKKIAIGVLVLLGLSLAYFVGWLGSRPGPNAPRFRPAQSQPRLGGYQVLSYEFLSPSPFEGGRMWISARQGTNSYHCFLFDIDRRLVLGELFNAGPVSMTRDQSKLLCVQWTTRQWSLQAWIAALFKCLSHRYVSFPHVGDQMQVFWVVDLSGDTATRIGEASGAHSTSQPSPGFRYSYDESIGVPQAPQILVSDLERKTLARIRPLGWPQGWWDERSIVIKDPTNNFILFDVVTARTSPLLSSAEVAGYFKNMHIPADPATANLFWIWTGKENDFYLTDLRKKWEAVESFLIKVGRPEPTLSLVSTNFKFEWSDHLDSTARYYLYSGRDRPQASSAVFLRDLRNNANGTLVPSDGGNYHSIPRFYREGVIYVRSNMLWRVDLNGSNQTRVFPPPEIRPEAGGR